MKRIICFLFCIVLVFVLCACGSDPSQMPSTVSLDEVHYEDIQNVSSNMIRNEFDEKFMEFIAKHTDGNYMVSPLSFRYALGLLLAGAEGETAKEMLNALNVESIDEWTSYCAKFNGFTKQFYERLESEIQMYNELYKDGNTDKNGSAPTRAIRVANSVWKRENIKADFTSEYKEYISKNYSAEYNTFTKKNAVKKINDWVNDKTQKLIPKLLADNYKTENLAVVLMNALYFKNSWQKPFEKSQTQEGDFSTIYGKTTKKSFMEQINNYNYYSDDKTQAVILPMKSGVNMAFVIGDTSDICEKISKSESARVRIKIPKIDIETCLNQNELINFLTENGATDAFNPKKADFSKMINHKIWVDDIIQKTRIKTDEEGVEAAAVTAIMVNDTAIYPIQEKPIEFIADRPFSFYIYTTYDDVTAILFAGMLAE